MNRMLGMITGAMLMLAPFGAYAAECKVEDQQQTFLENAKGMELPVVVMTGADLDAFVRAVESVTGPKPAEIITIIAPDLDKAPFKDVSGEAPITMSMFDGNACLIGNIVWPAEQVRQGMNGILQSNS